LIYQTAVQINNLNLNAMLKDKFGEAFEELIQPIVQRCVAQELAKNKELTVKKPEQWLSIHQARLEFGCSDHTLRKAMLKLELPYYQTDSRTYIKRIEVHRYLESIKIKSKDDPEPYSFLIRK